MSRGARHEFGTLALSGEVGYIGGGDAEPENIAEPEVNVEWEQESFVEYVMFQVCRWESSD